MDPPKASPKPKTANVDKGKKRRRKLKPLPNLTARRGSLAEAVKAKKIADQPKGSVGTNVQPSTSAEQNQQGEKIDVGIEMVDSDTEFESGSPEERNAQAESVYNGAGNSFRELAAPTEEAEKELEALINQIREKKETDREGKTRNTNNGNGRQKQQQQQQQVNQNAKQQKQQQQGKGKTKIPPINIINDQANDTIKLCKLAIGNRFYIKRFSGNKHAVMCLNLEDYKKVKSVLERAKTQFYTFTVKTEKIQTVLLKGVDPAAEPEELLNELKTYESDELNFVSVKPFSTAASRGGQRQLPFFLVQLSPTSKVDSLKKIRYLNYHVVTWDKINKRDGVLQCMRCQRFGHAAANCNLPFRCVKCDQDHKPGECPLGKDRLADRSQLFCVLCRQKGHPANYRGCPKYEELKKRIRARKQQLDEERRQKSRMFQNFVAPNVSFAQMASGSGQSTRQQTQRVAPAPPAADMDLKAVLLTLQGQIAQIQKQLNEQASRIDLIYSTLFAEPDAP